VIRIIIAFCSGICIDVGCILCDSFIPEIWIKSSCALYTLFVAMEMGGIVSEEGELEWNGVPTRKKLKSYDLLAYQAYNPMGKSGIANASLTDVWDKMKSGNKTAVFFSEYCDEDTERHGIAFSRMCQVLGEALAELIENQCFEDILQDEVYNKAKAEAVEVLPSLRMLNRRVTLFERVYPAARNSMSEFDFAQHYGIVEAFINNKKSMVKLLLTLLSGGGVFFSAYVHEKCTLSYFNFLSNDKPAIVSNLRHYYVSVASSTGQPASEFEALVQK
jgi:hypothetical protein